MKGKNYWACFLMILAGIVIGGFIGNLFPNTFRISDKPLAYRLRWFWIWGFWY